MIILSGGTGKRFSMDCPKQYHTILNKEVIAYSIEASQNSQYCNETIVVVATNFVEPIHKKYGVHSVEGGFSRNESLKRGLEYIKNDFPSCDSVLINEAARPFITAELIDDYFKTLDEYDAVITTRHITDSLGSYKEAVIDRSEYYLVQAPEAFRFKLLYQHFDAKSPITATVQQLPPNINVYRNFEFRNNLKITYPEDLMIAEHLMKHLKGI